MARWLDQYKKNVEKKKIIEAQKKIEAERERLLKLHKKKLQEAIE